MAQRAAVAEVDEDVTTVAIPQGYRRAFLKCRALGHSWIHSTDVLMHETKAWVRGLSSLCDSCGTVRVRWLNSAGRREGMTYNYPDGYCTKKADRDKKRDGLPAPRPVEWRREFVSHLNFPRSSAPIRR